MTIWCRPYFLLLVLGSSWPVNWLHSFANLRIRLFKLERSNEDLRSRAKLDRSQSSRLIYMRGQNRWITMPEQETLRKAAKVKREGKSPSTQAGEFVREEIHHIREGKHGARSTKQAIAIGLSKARRAGVDLKPPKKGRVSRETSQSAKRDYEAGLRPTKEASASRSKASLKALRREGKSSASSSALSRQARRSARSRAAR